jgi:phosphopantothenoylcysteine decarboxylase/phosphopantothenate--cysteine ligase
MARKRRLRIVITSGPTREPIDPARFMSNYSTGYMGAQLAAQALRRGHRVTVISGPAAEPLPSRARVVRIEDARQLEAALRRHAKRQDAVIMAAAVADFRAARPSMRKLSRGRGLTLRLQATPDIIGRMPRRAGQVVAGFAVESAHVPQRAVRKLRAKRLDLLLAQAVRPDGAPFGRRPVQAWLVARGRGGIRVTALGRRSKRAVAGLLLDKVEGLCYGQTKADA